MTEVARLHWRVSVGVLVRSRPEAARKRLRGAPLAVVYLLWAGVQDPFEESPVVSETYAALADATGYAPRSISNATRELVDQGIIEKLGSRPGVGMTYRLIRPVVDDVLARTLARQNPFTCPTEQGVVKELVRALGRATEPKRRRKRTTKTEQDTELRLARKETLTRIGRKRSEIALALEHGKSPPLDAEPTLRFSGDGAFNVNAAIDFLAEHSWNELLDRVALAKHLGIDTREACLAKHRKKIDTAEPPPLSKETESDIDPLAVHIERLRPLHPNLAEADLRELAEWEAS